MRYINLNLPKCIFVATLLIFSHLCLNAQENFNIKFTIEGIEGESVRYTVFGNKNLVKIDELGLAISNNSFVVKGEAKDQAVVRITFNNKSLFKYVEGGGYIPSKGSSLWLVVSPGAQFSMTGSLKGHDYVNIYPDGDIENKYLADLNSKMLPLINEKVDYVVKSEKKELSKEEKDDYNKKASDIEIRISQIREEFIDSFPSSIAALWLMEDILLRRQMEPARMELPLSKVDTRYHDNYFFKVVKERIIGARQSIIGKDCPEIKGTLNTGESFDIKEMRGKYVIIDFWGTWCGACLAGTAKMKAFRDSLKDKVEILGIAKDDSDKWSNFLKRRKDMNWPHILSGEGETDYISKFNVQGFPTKILVNPNGKIVYRESGENDEFYKKIGDIIKSDQEKKQDISVLYVYGTSDYDIYRNPSKEEISASVNQRKDSFVSFLNNYFRNFDIVSGDDYTEDMSDKYSVTVFDSYLKGFPGGGSNVVESKKKYVASKRLSDDFSRPSVVIADVADHIGRSIGLKTDWYCLCLDAYAHSFNLEHPIFKGPYSVTPTIEKLPTPSDAFHYEYYTGSLPDSIPMWRVQNKGFMTNKGYRIGMVSRPWGFTDSPECESISSGVCQKTLDAVAIGRHGNFFFWGFSASPKEMTSEARDVFANSIVYIASLKESGLIARKYDDRSFTKDYVKELTYLSTDKAVDDRMKFEQAFYRRMLQEGRKTSEPKPIDREAFFKKYMGTYYQMFNGNTKAYRKWLSDNYDYLYGDKDVYSFSVDEDAKKWGIANSDIKLLDKAISVLARYEKKEDKSGKALEEYSRAKRILDRYTLCTFEKASDWKNWLDSNRENIFFTQSGGWYFMVNTHDKTIQGNDYDAKDIYLAQKNIKLEEVNHSNPVVCSSNLVILSSGNQVIITKIKIADGYHIYANVSDTDPYVKTQINYELPSSYILGKTIVPEGLYFNDSGTTQYEGELVFVQYIFGASTNISKDLVCITASWQCCDTKICFPPVEKKITLNTTLQKSMY